MVQIVAIPPLVAHAHSCTTSLSARDICYRASIALPWRVICARKCRSPSLFFMSLPIIVHNGTFTDLSVSMSGWSTVYQCTLAYDCLSQFRCTSMGLVLLLHQCRLLQAILLPEQVLPAFSGFLVLLPQMPRILSSCSQPSPARTQ